jgi:L-lactate dehydrogenase complex protein LldG
MREKFLDNLQQQLRSALVPDARPEHPGLFTGQGQSSTDPEALLQGFIKELEALAGRAYVVDTERAAAKTIIDIVRRNGGRQLLGWKDDQFIPAVVRTMLGEFDIEMLYPSLSVEQERRAAELVALDGVLVGLTGAHGALADSGAIALISGLGRGRIASLLPPVHIALLSRRKIYPTLPAFLAAHPQTPNGGSNLVFIAGPSRTADIEMTLTMGVHGPGEMHVVIIP